MPGVFITCHVGESNLSSRHTPRDRVACVGTKCLSIAIDQEAHFRIVAPDICVRIKKKESRGLELSEGAGGFSLPNIASPSPFITFLLTFNL